MNHVKRRILFLNLILLVTLLLILPVSGSQSEKYTMLLHGNGGTIHGQEQVLVEGTTVLPEAVFRDDEFLGWSTSLSVSPTDLFLLPGQWWPAGATVTPSAGTENLYAQAQKGGQYAIFDPNGGQVTQGGEMLVYGSVTTTDLILLLPDGGGLTAPTGYTFRGWDLNGTPYAAGAKLALRKGAPLYLRARWELPEGVKELENGLYLLDGETIQVFGRTAAAQVVCAVYDKNDKMCVCQVDSGEIDMKIEKKDGVLCKIFLLDGAGAPLDRAITVKLS